MNDLTERLSEVNEESPAFGALMLRLGRTLDSNFNLDFLDDGELDSSWDREIGE